MASEKSKSYWDLNFIKDIPIGGKTEEWGIEKENSLLHPVNSVTPRSKL